MIISDIKLGQKLDENDVAQTHQSKHQHPLIFSKCYYEVHYHSISQ